MHCGAQAFISVTNLDEDLCETVRLIVLSVCEIGEKSKNYWANFFYLQSLSKSLWNIPKLSTSVDSQIEIQQKINIFNRISHSCKSKHILHCFNGVQTKKKTLLFSLKRRFSLVATIMMHRNDNIPTTIRTVFPILSKNKTNRLVRVFVNW